MERPCRDERAGELRCIKTPEHWDPSSSTHVSRDSRATEKPVFVKTAVPEGAPTCFISYAHEMR